MIATSRIQRRYDHRLQAMVRNAGSLELARQHGIPKSTARGWLKHSNSSPVVSTDVVTHDMVQLQQEICVLRRRVQRLTTLLRLMIIFLKLSGFSFARFRLQEGNDKRKLLRALDQCRTHISLRIVLRMIGLSHTRYHQWKLEHPCGLDDILSCPKSSPKQITSKEIKIIREMVTSEEFRHVPTGGLARLAERLGKVFASSSTWYRLMRKHQLRRPRLRVYPAKPKIGIRASKANEIWHVDATQIRLLDGRQAYIDAIIDNFSRRILAWNVAENFEPSITAQLLRNSLTGKSSETTTLMVDGGVENYNSAVDEVLESGMLKRVLAQTDINFSNSMIES